MAIVNTAKKKLLDGDIDLLVDDIKVALLTNVHTTNIDTQEFWSDVLANEITATGYTANGQSLTTPATVVDTVNDRCDFDADDSVWTITGALTARYAVIHKWTGVTTTSPIIAIVDFGTDKSVTDGTFTIQWDATGILRLT